MQRFTRTLYGLAVVLGCSVSLAWAAPPDAGSLLNQQRQPGASLPLQLPQPEDKVTESPPAAEDETRIVVRGFRFTGLDGLAEESELQTLLANSLDQELGVGDLQALAARVTAYLRDDKGFLLAKAYLPKQDVSDGTVEIAVLAGRIDGKVRINVRPPSRIDPAFLEAIADRAVPAGSPARMARMERAVLLLSDLPGVHAQASLEPGADRGTTRMTINADEGPLFSGALIGDNFGDRYTGAWRGTGQFQVNDPSGRGDQLKLSGTGAEHLVQGWVSYGGPLGSTGLTAEFSYTALSYDLGEDLSDLDAKGSAQAFELNASYPFVRTRKASLWGGLGVEYQTLTDEASGATIRDRDIPLGKMFLAGSSYDTLGGGGLTSATLTFYGGDLDLSNAGGAKTFDAAGSRAAGGFVRSTYALARLQRLSRDLSIMAAVRGQLSADNLDSSQKFILGGPSGVRAYPVSEGSGDEGHLLTAEIRYDLPLMPGRTRTQLVGFFDAGRVKLHHDPWPGAVVNASGRNDYWLSGGGVGMNIGKPGVYDIRCSYAHAFGDNDGRSISGDNGDNRSDHHRFWLQAIVWF